MGRLPDVAIRKPTPVERAKSAKGAEAPPPPPPTAGEQIAAGFDLGIDSISNIDRQREIDSYGPLVTALVERGYPVERYVSLGRSGGGGLNIGALREDLETERKKDPSFGKDYGRDDAEFAEKRKQKQIANRRYDQQTLARGPQMDVPLLGQINPIGFVGQFGGAMLDPVNLVLAPFGGGGATVGKSMVRGALVGAGTEVALLPEQARLAGVYDEEFTVKDAVASVTLGALFGTVFGAGEYGWRKTSAARQARRAAMPGREAMDIARPYLPEDLRHYTSFDDMTPEELRRASEVELPREAIPDHWADDMIVAEDDAYFDATNPFGNNGEGIALHDENLANTLDSIMDGPLPAPRRPIITPPRAPDTPMAPAATGSAGQGQASPTQAAPLANPLTLVEGGRKSSTYGKRSAPVKGASTDHKGLDIAAPIGTPIKSSGDGVVVFSGKAGAAGNMVIVDHGGGVFSRYFHMSAMDVKKGDRVTGGGVIGKVGKTGRVSGPHLHYEVILDGVFDANGNRKSGTKVNPETFTGRAGDAPAAAAPRTAGSSNADADFKRMISGAESGNDYTITNKLTGGAYGKYQYERDTWIGEYSQMKGVSRATAAAEFDKGRWKDPALTEQMMDRSLKNYRGWLGDMGVPVTPINLYVMHALGPHLGKYVLKASPNEPIADVLARATSAPGYKGPSAKKIIAQNGAYYSGGKTVAQSLDHMNGKLGGPKNGGAASGVGGDAAPSAAFVDPDAEARARLADEMAETQRTADALDEQRAMGGQDAPLMPDPAPRDPIDLGGQDTAPPAPRLIDGLSPEQSAAVPLIRQDIARPGVSLKPAAIAKRHGIAEADADAAINYLAARRDGVYQSAGRGSAPRFQRVASNGPEDILRYIARRGGIAKDGLGEGERLGGSRGHGLGGAEIKGGKRLGGRDWDKVFVPGAGNLVRPAGRGIDDMAESLWEAGYFGPPSSTPRPSVDEVLDVLESAVQGKKIYANGDAPEDMAATVEFDLEMDEGLMQAVRSFEEEVGIALTPDEIATYRSVVSYGDDADVALTKLAQARIDDAMIDLFYEEFPDRVPEIADQFNAEFDARFAQDYFDDDLDFRGRAERGELDPGDAGEGWSGSDVGEPSWWTREEAIDFERGPGGPLDTETLRAFDEPHGEGVTAQIDSMEHDARNVFAAPTKAEPQTGVDRALAQGLEPKASFGENYQSALVETSGEIDRLFNKYKDSFGPARLQLSGPMPDIDRAKARIVTEYFDEMSENAQQFLLTRKARDAETGEELIPLIEGDIRGTHIFDIQEEIAVAKTGDMFGGPTSKDVRASLERQADAPMRGATEQKAAGSDGGLFDNKAPTTSWMDDPAIRADMESFGLRMDDEGDVMNPADLLAELDDESAAIKTIRDCL